MTFLGLNWPQLMLNPDWLKSSLNWCKVLADIDEIFTFFPITCPFISLDHIGSYDEIGSVIDYHHRDAVNDVSVLECDW